MTNVTINVKMDSSGQTAFYRIGDGEPVPFTPTWTGNAGTNWLDSKTRKPSKTYYGLFDKDKSTFWLVPYVDKKERYLQRYRQRGEHMRKQGRL